MSTEQETIKHCYEVLGLMPQDIAEDRGLEVAAVKATLMSTSAKYRKACGMEESEKDELNFTDEDEKDVIQVIRDTAKFADDPHLRYNAAVYIREDRRGRKDRVKNMGNVTFNLLEFNGSLAKMRQAKDAMMARLSSNGGSIPV